MLYMLRVNETEEMH